MLNDSNLPNYRLNCGQYVLHRGDTPVTAPADEIALVFDAEEGILHKHGQVSSVQAWYDKTTATLRANEDTFSTKMAEALVLIIGRIPAADVNRCIENSSYAAVLLKKITDGTLEPEPLPYGPVPGLRR